MLDLNQAGKLNQEAMDTMLKSCSSMAKGFQTLASEAQDYSRKACEDGVAAIERLAGAKSVERALEIQADYAKTSYEAFVAQATRLGELYSDIARDAYRPYEAATAKFAG